MAIDTLSSIEKARQELIDKGMRNPLINYRLPRGKGLEIVRERSEDIYRLMVRETKAMDFQPDKSQPIATVKPSSSLDTPELPEDGSDSDMGQPEDVSLDLDPARFTDTHLQTAHPDQELQKRLRNTSEDARVFMEERGVNPLYLTLGELVWYDAESSDKGRRSPLILIPVTLGRKSINAKFTVQYTEAGVGENISLREALRDNFKLTFPSLAEEDSEGFDEATFDVMRYFAKIEQCIADFPKWEVRKDSINLGFFSFGKFMMYRDLDETLWPADVKPSQHPIVRAILGDGFERRDGDNTAGSPERATLEAYLALGNNSLVMDADSSQTAAIMAIKNGQSLAIQGPPGTGKSQTIANTIAELVGVGKTVLFVAEKMAALEVVKRRMDTLGLGDLCLELHSDKAKKSAVLGELQKTYKLTEPTNSNPDLSELESSRKALEAYDTQLHTPIHQTGLTPYRVYGEYLKLKAVLHTIDLPKWSIGNLKTWRIDDYQDRLDLVRDFQRKLAQDGKPKDNPFVWAGLTSFGAMLREDLERGMRELLKLLSALSDHVASLVELLGLNEPASLFGVERIKSLGAAFTHIPAEFDLEAALEDWSRLAPKMRDLVDVGQEFNKLTAPIAGQYHETAWSHNLAAVQQGLAKANFFTQLFNASVRKAKADFDSLVTTPPPSRGDRLKLAETLAQAQKRKAQLEEHETLAKRWFPDLWKGHRTDWEALSNLERSLTELSKAVRDGDIPKRVIAEITTSSRRKTSEAGHRLQTDFDSFQGLLEELLDKIDYSLDRRVDIKRLNLRELRAHLETWLVSLDQLQAMVSFNEIRRRFADKGFESFYDAVIAWEHAPDHTVNFFNYRWFGQLSDDALESRPALKAFERTTHDYRQGRFRDLDASHLQTNRLTLVKAHHQRLSKLSSSTGKMSVLNAEFNKKRKHKPIQRLIEEAYGAIQALKPVFMMSPMSVAAYLKPGTIEFDVLIFDEASQIRTAEALGCVLRAKQVVVVGDEQQMPPSNFFERESDSDDDETALSDYESILKLFIAKGIDQKMLRWHYRSEHESLIAVSNKEFYDSNLLIAPSPHPTSATVGLRLHRQTDSVYGDSVNREEAKTVAAAMIRHAQTSPELTLGVVAFSQKQMQAIRDALEVLRRQNPDCEAFFNGHPREPFFIKNLENVQGDERDVIFISIGYGRQADGRVSMSFGPLNREGGHRRLNVLISRARKRCEVFTNLSHEDISLERTSARGVAALKRFLQYAETGKIDLDRASGREPDSPFEEAVGKRLRDKGYAIDYQVGTAGFFIDLAVIDPNHPGKYVLGIECDGASYHSSASARDRDRLRQSILESKGWRIHRVWSTEWFKYPDRELDRIVKAIDEALRNTGADKVHSQEAPPQFTIERSALAPTPTEIPQPEYGVEAYTRYQDREINQYSDIDDVPTFLFDQIAREIITMEAPIHFDEFARRISRTFQIGNTTKRVKEAIRTRLGALKIRIDGEEFIPSSQPVKIRDRSGLPAESRKFEYIHSSEIRLIAKKICQNSIDIGLEELIAETCRTVGFARITQQMKERVQPIVHEMAKTGQLIERNGMYRAP